MRKATTLYLYMASKKPVAQVAVIALLIVGGFSILSRWSTYWTNDDLGNALILSGALSGEPDVRVPFHGIAFSALVVSLYSFTNTVPWYPLTLVALPAVSAVAMWRRINWWSGVGRVLMAVSAAVAVIFGMVLPNYTFASFCASSLVAVSIVVNREWTKVDWLVSVILLTLAMSLRSEATSFASLPLTGLYAVGTIGYVATLIQPRVIVLRLALTTTVSLSAIQVLHWLHLRGDSAYRQYLDFNSARGAVNDAQYVAKFLASDMNQKINAGNWLDPLSLDLLNSFESYEADVASTEKVSAIASHARATISSRFSLADIFMIDDRIISSWLRLICVVAIGALVMRPGVRRVLLALVIPMATAVVTQLLSVFVKMEVMVLRGTDFVALLAIMLALGFPSPKRGLKDSKTSFVAVGGFSALIMATSVLAVIPYAAEASRMREQAGGARQVLHEARSYVDIGWTSPHLVPVAFQPFPWSSEVVSVVKSTRLVWGGTPLRSPVWGDRWRRLTNSDMTDREIFNSSLVEKVAFSPERAAELASAYWRDRAECFVVIPALTTNWVNLRRSQVSSC